MKNLVLLMLVVSSLISFTNCGKIKERKMSDFDKLTSTTWVNYKNVYQGSGERFLSDTVYYNFYKDGTFKIECRPEPTMVTMSYNDYVWSLSNSTLHIGQHEFKTLCLTTTELTIESVNLGLVAYFRSLTR